MTTPARELLCSLIILVAFPLGAAATDPCDFATGGAIAFPYDQVVSCYESVPFNHDDLENILAVIAQHRSFSDLGELYDAKSNWIANLSALDDPSTEDDYPNDFAMHNAILAEHKNQLNPHVRYTWPACYSQMAVAFMPFDFGVTQRFLKEGEKQIVFIESAPFLPTLYQQVTGIDARELVGMKVVAINGVPALEYFRSFGREKLKLDDTDGVHLNEILNWVGYSVRYLPTRDFIPDTSADHYLLESRNGQQLQVTMPWVFVRPNVFGLPALPPSASTQEFIDLCTLPLPSPLPGGSTADHYGEIWRDDGELDRQRRIFVQQNVSGPKVTDKDFFEAPPGQIGKHVEVVIPFTDAAYVLQFKQNVTVLRVFNTVNWIDVARAGIEYACQNSDRLIVDVRGNGGGNDTVIRWLYHHLFPEEADLVEAGKLPLRMRNDNAKLNEFFFNSAVFEYVAVPQGFPPCAISIGPLCVMDLDTGDPLPINDLGWFLSPSFTELRAGVPVSLSRQFGLGLNFVNLFPEFDAASCAGRFAGKDLVFLADGTNGSGGYFLPAAFKGKAVIVTMGGYVDEPMSMGLARSGATFPASIWAILVELIEFVTGGQIHFLEDYLQFDRQVESAMEMWGAYRKDRTTLHFNDAIESDLRLPVWSDSPGTDGYVYDRLLEAVDAMH